MVPAKRAPRAVAEWLDSRAVPLEASVQIVVPCYDEAARLDLDAFSRALATEPRLVLRFVDDGSRDRTLERLRAFEQQHPGRVRLTTLPSNRGKAEAVRAGVLAALDDGPDYVGYWDADLSAPLDELGGLVAVLESDDRLAIALGSRVRLLGRTIERLAWRHYLGRVVATVAAWALGVAVYDTQCGAKLLRAGPAVRRVFASPFGTGWTFDVELLARWLRDRRAEGEPEPERAIVEVPLRVWRHVPGSKVRPSALPRALLELFWIRWHHR